MISPLVSSILALAAGPALLAGAGPRSRVLAFVDGFVVVTLGGIALLHILPHAVLEGGAWVLLAAIAGLALPLLAERRRPDAPHRDELVPVVAIAIAVHAFIDGSMLVDHQGEHGHGSSLLATAVVLHRLPEGLAVWWLVRPRRGARLAWLSLALVAVATVAGATVGEALVARAPSSVVAVIEAFVAGALLHVLTHHAPPASGAHQHQEHSHEHAHHEHHAHTVEPGAPPRAGLAPALGAMAGVATLAGVAVSHPVAKRLAHEVGMGSTFLTLALESAPALLASYVAAALIHAFLPVRSLDWMKRGSVLGQAVRGTLLGPLLPTCSCGVLPLYRSLVARGVPPAAALSLLVAAPEIGLTSVLLSISLLGTTLTAARAATALVTAVVVGYVGGRVAARRESTAPMAAVSAPEPKLPASQRLRLGIRYGLGESIDHTVPWLLVGLLVASFVEPTFGGQWLGRAATQLDVPLFALIGIPMYVCAAGATPVVAVLLHKGLSPGAGVAFLLTGPATNITTFGMLAKLHGRAVAASFAVSMLVVSTLLGLLVNLLVPRPDLPGLHDAAHGAAHPVEIASLAVLALLLLGSLLRQGPRGLVAQLSLES